MTRKIKVNISPSQKLEYAKLMVEEGYSNKQIQDISEACLSAISRWKRQYETELSGYTPKKYNAITPDQQRIHVLEKQLQRDNEKLK